MPLLQKTFFSVVTFQENMNGLRPTQSEPLMIEQDCESFFVVNCGEQSRMKLMMSVLMIEERVLFFGEH